ncbi:hypothetical protein CXB51_017955 [Gossypium anomalum]|uniref:hAT-like transposase RNase-H fold domain-containing protein n=1 Tax=Gossypium anomalum TaxID=47600 RepID=A0A8J6D3F2_9ROSI|nr:hypothetical protein CXB51_017955 [Gossypium anomalum]
MSTEPTSIEGSVIPPTSIDSENSGVGAPSQTKGITGKRKATPQSHKGESIGIVIEKCLLNWGIDKLFTVTVDNASSNDNFERAFERFKEQDTNFRAELERGEGWPSVDNWANVRDLRDFLEHFYEVTLRISGNSYVTSNNFFDELSEIDILLRDAQLNSSVDFNVMAIKIKEKYDNEMSSSEKASEMMQKLKESLYELFDEYKPPLHSTCSQSSVPTHVSLGEPQQKMKRRMQALYKKRELEICGENKTSELDKYLAKANEEFVEDFDILLW